MDLNPIAKALRLERQMAELEVRAATAAMNPPALAVTQAHLALVKARQVLLSLKQKALIIQARSESLAAPIKAKTAVTSGLNSEVSANGGSQTRALAGVKSRSRFGVFDVEATPAKDLTPNYQPSTKFTARQTADVNIDMELRSASSRMATSPSSDERPHLKNSLQGHDRKTGDRMDRNTERGQMMIEVMILALMFAGFFLLAIGISQDGERAQTKYRFSQARSSRQ